MKLADFKVLIVFGAAAPIFSTVYLAFGGCR